MQLVKSILKYIFYFIIASIVIGTLIISYKKYQIALEKEEELKYKTTRNWKWHDEYRRIQISTDDEFNQSTLRKVYMDKYAIYALKWLDHKLHVKVIFYVKCTPKSVIKTSKKFSDGSIKELVCLDDGEGLRFSVVFPDRKVKYSWEEDLDGFSFKEDIQYWDFTKLDQEITLFNAKMPEDTDTDTTNTNNNTYMTKEEKVVHKPAYIDNGLNKKVETKEVVQPKKVEPVKKQEVIWGDSVKIKPEAGKKKQEVIWGNEWRGSSSSTTK